MTIEEMPTSPLLEAHVLANSVQITKGEAYAIAENIDHTLIKTIREDADIDSMRWLRDIVHGYEKLCEYSGYIGLTE